MQSDKVCFLAKLESAAGVDASPATSANEIELLDYDINPIYQPIVRKPLRTSLSPRSIKKSLKLWEIKFRTELKGSGSQGTAGRLAALFKACALSENVQAGSSVLYTPGNPGSTITLYHYVDGLLFKILGARGQGVITAEAGKIAYVDWTFRGKYSIPTDADLPTPTYEETTGIVVESAGAAISGYEGVIRSLSLDFGVEFLDRPNVNAAGAMQGVNISGRTPKIKALMEAELRAKEDIWGEWDADTLINFACLMGSAGNRFGITATGKAQYEDLKVTKENGMLMYDLGLALSGTDDEYTAFFS